MWDHGLLAKIVYNYYDGVHFCDRVLLCYSLFEYFFTTLCYLLEKEWSLLKLLGLVQAVTKKLLSVHERKDAKDTNCTICPNLVKFLLIFQKEVKFKSLVMQIFFLNFDIKN